MLKRLWCSKEWWLYNTSKCISRWWWTTLVNNCQWIQIYSNNFCSNRWWWHKIRDLLNIQECLRVKLQFISNSCHLSLVKVCLWINSKVMRLKSDFFKCSSNNNNKLTLIRLELAEVILFQVLLQVNGILANRYHHKCNRLSCSNSLHRSTSWHLNRSLTHHHTNNRNNNSFWIPPNSMTHSTNKYFCSSIKREVKEWKTKGSQLQEHNLISKEESLVVGNQTLECKVISTINTTIR